MREQHRHRVFGRVACERRGDVVPPELDPHAADGRRGRGVRDAGELDVEGADGEVGRSGRGWDEGLKRVGGRIVFPGVSGVRGLIALDQTSKEEKVVYRRSSEQ